MVFFWEQFLVYHKSRYDMDRWGDYWRFTDLSIKMLFEEVYGKGNVEVVVYGNVISSIAFLEGLAIEDLPNLNILDKQDRDYQMILGIKAVKNA